MDSTRATDSDGNTTGCPGGCPLCLIPVPTLAITMTLMGYSPAPQAAGLEEWQNFGRK